MSDNHPLPCFDDNAPIGTNDDDNDWEIAQIIDGKSGSYILTPHDDEPELFKEYPCDHPDFSHEMTVQYKVPPQFALVSLGPENVDDKEGSFKVTGHIIRGEREIPVTRKDAKITIAVCKGRLKLFIKSDKYFDELAEVYMRYNKLPQAMPAATPPKG